jgi:acid phosphatase family membrane protein YuiD
MTQPLQPPTPDEIKTVYATLKQARQVRRNADQQRQRTQRRPLLNIMAAVMLLIGGILYFTPLSMFGLILILAGQVAFIVQQIRETQQEFGNFIESRLDDAEESAQYVTSTANQLATARLEVLEHVLHTLTNFNTQTVQRFELLVGPLEKLGLLPSFTAAVITAVTLAQRAPTGLDANVFLSAVVIGFAVLTALMAGLVPIRWSATVTKTEELILEVAIKRLQKTN